MKYGDFRYIYSNEKMKYMERSKLVATREESKKIERLLTNVDLIESFAGEQANPKWKFYTLTNVMFFPALLIEVPMGCKNAVLPEPFFINHSACCLSSEKSSREPYIDNRKLITCMTFHFNVMTDWKNRRLNCLLPIYRT